jgi:hypothetical protein
MMFVLSPKKLCIRRKRTYSNIMWLLHLLQWWRWCRDLHHNVRWLTGHLSFEALQLSKTKTHFYERSEAFTVAKIHIVAFLVIAPCSLVGEYQLYGGR